MPVQIDVSIPIGASGAIGTISGPGVKAATRLAAGVIQLQMQDNYNTFLYGKAIAVSPQTGSAVNDGSFTIGDTYQIVTVGTTTWNSYGLPAGVTPAVGAAFVATSAGGAGTGTAKLVTSSNVSHIELAGDPTLTIAPTGVGNGGAYVLIQTMAPVFTYNSGTPASSTVTYAPADAVSGTIIKVVLTMNNSSLPQ